MPKKDTRKRVELRVSQERYDQIKHFADKEGLSINAWIEQACIHMVDFINSDYDVPTAEIQRVNQLSDSVEQLIELMNHLINVNVNGFDAMSTLMHGSNYLGTDMSNSDNNNTNNGSDN